MQFGIFLLSFIRNTWMCFAAWEPLFSLIRRIIARCLKVRTCFIFPEAIRKSIMRIASRLGKGLQSIRNYAESGGRVLAECGGMIYLSKGILLDRSEHSDSEVGLQAGVLPFFISNRKADRRLTLGTGSSIITANIFADTSFTIHNSSRTGRVTGICHSGIQCQENACQYTCVPI